MLTNDSAGEEDFVEINTSDVPVYKEPLLSQPDPDHAKEDDKTPQNQIRISNASYDDIESDDVAIEFTCHDDKNEKESKNPSLLNVVTVLRPNFSECRCSSSILHIFPITVDDVLEKQKKWKTDAITKKTRLYYRKLDRLVDSFKDTATISSEFDYDGTEDVTDPRVAFAAKLSFAFNLLLFTAKIAASVLTGSLSIISSVVDSAVDLISGVVIWYTSRAIRLTNIYNYPTGRNRLEPIAILMLSTIMGSASVLVVRESVETVISGTVNIDLTAPSIAIIVVTIVCKFGLFIYCRLIKSPSTKVLALDHRNDVISNALALGFSALGTHVWKYADPVGAILISVYIFANWWNEGAKQIRNLAGHTAPSWFLQIITWMCLQHSPHIIGVETVRATSIGTNYLVEVHIALPRHMSLDTAHDIGEALQRKIENLDRVEQAFVHLDYDCVHDPETEHKPVIKSKKKSTSSA